MLSFPALVGTRPNTRPACPRHLQIDICARADELTGLLENQRKDQEVADLLTGMCSCLGKAISTNQEAICDWLFNADKRPMLYKSLPKLSLSRPAATKVVLAPCWRLSK